MTNLGELYVRFTFDLVGRDAFDHLHWGLFEDMPRTLAYLPLAQERYAERVVAMVPRDAVRVLDVGCGLGGIARMLARAGHEVTAISPRADHIERIAAAAHPGIRAECTTFEALPTPDRPFDALVFSESLNFFLRQRDGEEATSAAALAARCARQLRVGGQLVLADIVTERTHEALTAMPGFTLRESHDVHDAASFSATAFQKLFERAAGPYHALLMETLAVHSETLRDEVRVALDAVPNRALRDLFAGRMTEPDLADERRYRFYRAERCDDAS